jgi:hypothetical protein
VLRLSRRFSIRTMLVSVALIAATIVVTRDYVRVQSARDQFDWLLAHWEAGRVLPETVVAGSYPLMDAEESTLWISKRAATSRHVARLKYILGKMESPLSESNRDTTKRRAASIREEIRRYDPDAVDEQTENPSQSTATEASDRQ